MEKNNQQLVLRMNTAAGKGDVMRFMDDAITYYTAEGLPCPAELTQLLHDDMTQQEKISLMQRITIEIHNATVAK